MLSPSQPHPSVATNLPLNKAILSWASKAAWKHVLEKNHSPLGKENNFLWDLEILKIHPYLHRVNHNFLVQYLGNEGL